MSNQWRGQWGRGEVLPTQHTNFISLSHFNIMKDPSSKRQLAVYTISAVHNLNFYFY